MADKNKKPVVYVFDISQGAGIPGLPHEITEAEAAELGVLDLLQEAIKNGSYAVKEK